MRAIGKSDPIDVLACARAALAENLPVAVPETDVREIKILLDHREDLVGEMVRMCCRLAPARHRPGLRRHDPGE